ncbi:hypothetical protein Tco_0601713 [Tanacetum coccineum]
MYSTLNHLNLDMDMENLFNMQEYYAGQGLGHDYYVGQGSGGKQEFYTGQDYFIGQGLAHSSAHDSASIEEDSLVEEVARSSKLRGFQNFAKRLITGNAVKNREFWLKVIEYFEKETGLNQGYDTILSKWKNRVRHIIGAFCAIFDNVQWKNESGSCDLTVYQKACVEYAAEYNHDYLLERCWQILKNHSAWKEEANGSEEEEVDGSEKEVQEVRPIGQDRAKKKSSSSSRSEASCAAGGSIIDMVADKWKSLKSVSWGKKNSPIQT